jgi:hypothetical protein
MKNFTFLALIALGASFAFVPSAQANLEAYPRMTLAEAKKQPDESRMSIQGQFLNRHRGEEDEFVFQDTENKKIVVFDNSNGRDKALNLPFKSARRDFTNLLLFRFGNGRLPFLRILLMLYLQ